METNTYKVEKIKSKRYTLIQGDCMNYLSQIPDKSIDLILTDPPYNIAQYSTGNIPLPGRSALNNDLGEWDLTPIEPIKLIDDFKRLLKPEGNIFIFTSYNLIGKWHEVFDKEFDTFQFFIWHKTNPAPKIYKNGFVIINGAKTKDFWDGSICSENKPLRLKIRNICGDETVWEV